MYKLLVPIKDKLSYEMHYSSVNYLTADIVQGINWDIDVYIEETLNRFAYRGSNYIPVTDKEFPYYVSDYSFSEMLLERGPFLMTNIQLIAMLEAKSQRYADQVELARKDMDLVESTLTYDFTLKTLPSLREYIKSRETFKDDFGVFQGYSLRNKPLIESITSFMKRTNRKKIREMNAVTGTQMELLKEVLTVAYAIKSGVAYPADIQNRFYGFAKAISMVNLEKKHLEKLLNNEFDYASVKDAKFIAISTHYPQVIRFKYDKFFKGNHASEIAAVEELVTLLNKAMLGGLPFNMEVSTLTNRITFEGTNGKAGTISRDGISIVVDPDYRYLNKEFPIKSGDLIRHRPAVFTETSNAGVNYKFQEIVTDSISQTLARVKEYAIDTIKSANALCVNSDHANVTRSQFDKHFDITYLEDTPVLDKKNKKRFFVIRKQPAKSHTEFISGWKTVETTYDGNFGIFFVKELTEMLKDGKVDYDSIPLYMLGHGGEKITFIPDEDRLDEIVDIPDQSFHRLKQYSLDKKNFLTRDLINLCHVNSALRNEFFKRYKIYPAMALLYVEINEAVKNKQQIKGLKAKHKTDAVKFKANNPAEWKDIENFKFLDYMRMAYPVGEKSEVRSSFADSFTDYYVSIINDINQIVDDYVNKKGIYANPVTTHTANKATVNLVIGGFKFNIPASRIVDFLDTQRGGLQKLRLDIAKTALSEFNVDITDIIDARAELEDVEMNFQVGDVILRNALDGIKALGFIPRVLDPNQAFKPGTVTKLFSKAEKDMIYGKLAEMGAFELSYSVFTDALESAVKMIFDLGAIDNLEYSLDEHDLLRLFREMLRG